MRYDNGTIYPPDNLAYPVVYSGDSAVQGLLGQPTISTLNDEWLSGNTAGGTPEAQRIANLYGTAQQPATADPCAQYPMTDSKYWLCKADQTVTGKITKEIYGSPSDAMNPAGFLGDSINRAGLFLLALLVLGVGLWAMLK